MTLDGKRTQLWCDTISRTLLLLTALALGWHLGARAQDYTYQELFAFAAFGTNGYKPAGALVQGTDGNFYGTCEDGGQPTTNCPACGYGTVFKITPEGILTTLARFHGTAGFTNGEGWTNYGGYPFGQMVQATDGNFYGDSNYGLFRVTSGGVLTAMAGGTLGDPIEATNGYLYTGNPYYSLVAWYSLAGTTIGSAHPSGTPSGGLIQASDGNFYGLTYDGGAGGGASGFGTAYKLTPGGVLTTLVSFGGTNIGRWPYGKMLQASDGNLYGVCDSPEQVFKLTLSGALTTFAIFGTNGDWGYSPNGGLIEANDGNLYGTTFEGGGIGGAQGTVFKISPEGHVSTLVVFSYKGTYPGSGPLAGLVQGSDGNLYGTCAYGGTYDGGNIFRIIMPGPQLDITNLTGQTVLSWRTNYIGYTVQSSTNMVTSAWKDLTDTPVASNGRFWITNSLSAGTEFFRLAK